MVYGGNYDVLMSRWQSECEKKYYVESNGFDVVTYVAEYEDE